MSRKMPVKVRQGQIYDIDIPVSIGSVQAGTRPILISSSDRRNRSSGTYLALSLTSQIKRLDLPEHVLLPRMSFLPKETMAMAEQRFTIDRSQLLRYRGRLDWLTWLKVHRAIRCSERTSKAEYEKE